MSLRMFFRLAIFFVLLIIGLALTVVGRELRSQLDISEVEARYNFLANFVVEIFGAAMIVFILEIYLRIFDDKADALRTPDREDTRSLHNESDIRTAMRVLQDETALRQIWDALDDRKKVDLVLRLLAFNTKRDSLPHDVSKACS
jgi:hypothetical protein